MAACDVDLRGREPGLAVDAAAEIRLGGERRARSEGHPGTRHVRIEGLDPDHSLQLIELVGRNPQVRGVLIGHTHRNRVRHYPAAGHVPFIEVHCTKDYPGGFAHYRLFEDGSFRQEVRRTPSERALFHSTRCRSLFNGQYQHFTMGTLEERSFIAAG